jgi:putative ABC transport system permease protein
MGIRQDLQRSVRALLGKPQFGVVAVLTLALGLGANTAIFSVMYGVLLRPLPVTDEDRIVVAWKRDPAANNPLVELSVAEFRDWQAHSRSFESMAVRRRSRHSQQVDHPDRHRSYRRGVMPPGYQFPSGADVWMPLTAGMPPTALQNRRGWCSCRWWASCGPA